MFGDTALCAPLVIVHLLKTASPASAGSREIPGAYSMLIVQRAIKKKSLFEVICAQGERLEWKNAEG